MNNSVKKFTKLLSDSSKKLLASFLSDGTQAQKNLDHIKQQVHLAFSQQSLVVLQVKTGTNPKDSLETIAGKIVKKNSPEIFMIKDQKTHQLRVVKMNDIKKISMLQSRISNRVPFD